MSDAVMLRVENVSKRFGGLLAVDGASFDNNVLCVAEKEVFMVNSIADSLMNTMEKCGAYRVYGEDIDKIVRTVLIQKDGKYVINRKFVGHDATSSPTRRAL